MELYYARGFCFVCHQISANKWKSVVKWMQKIKMFFFDSWNDPLTNKTPTMKWRKNREKAPVIDIDIDIDRRKKIEKKMLGWLEIRIFMRSLPCPGTKLALQRTPTHTYTEWKGWKRTISALVFLLSDYSVMWYWSPSLARRHFVIKFKSTCAQFSSFSFAHI